MSERLTERLEVRIFGVLVGTADEWFPTGESAVQFKNFKPEVEFVPYIIKCEALDIDMESGEIGYVKGDNTYTVNTPMFLSLLSTAAAGMGK